MTRHTLGWLGTACLLACAWAGGCADVPLDYPRTASFAFRSPQDTELGRAVEPQAATHPGESGLLLLPTGTEALVARVVLAAAAQKSLDVQYFVFEDDLVGNLVLDRLLAAADRGVRVRLLVDDFYQLGQDPWLAAINSHPNIEVRTYNPVGGARAWDLSRTLYYAFGPRRFKGRMHNKLLIADGAAAIVGGRNIADEYFGAHEEFNYADQDLLAIGPAARQGSDIFDQYWNAPLAIPIAAFQKAGPNSLGDLRASVAKRVAAASDSPYAQALRDSTLLQQILTRHVPWLWGDTEELADHPGKALMDRRTQPQAFMATRLIAALDAAQSEVLMVSPYFVPGPWGVDWFRTARARGVTVKIITNSLASTDEPASYGGLEPYRKDLLRAGVELYELRPDPQLHHAQRQRPGGQSRAALHAKLLILDRAWVFVGSFNLDPRSSRLDTQNGILVHSPQLAAQLIARFDQGASPAYSYHLTLDHGRLTWTTETAGRKDVYHAEPQTGLGRRLNAWLLGGLAPEEWL